MADCDLFANPSRLFRVAEIYEAAMIMILISDF
jgi:hypothetical protein